MLNQVLIVSAFLLALAQGNATFYFTYKRTKYAINLSKQGVATAPNLSAIATLADAALGLMMSGMTSTQAQVKVGASEWLITVTA